MIIFNGTKLGGWKLWGIWFKHKYYFGFSKQLVGGTYMPKTATPKNESNGK